MKLLKGKRALITGGSSGIGLEIARLFAEQGASVTIMGTNREKGERALKEIETSCLDEGQMVYFQQVDVSSSLQVKEGLEQILSRWDGVDILVNCAGITRDKLLMKMSEEDWDAVLDINLKSLYLLCHGLIRHMLKAKYGKIINISSVLGLTGNPGQVNYCSAKAGIIGFTQALAKEVASKGINVNCIAPGFIQTAMTDQLSEKQKEQIMQQVPMGRLGSTREIANAALFLASSLSDYMTGEVFAVDGGMTA